ncbi:Glycosyl transferase family 2 [Lentzea xinjiangensis]|uniref:Glycosyl transferase family 2 n=1 Tax=Lentzea xinjiangensis TaxID=402600 RepID=A0A1H9RZE9_9PSEU|nr:glycosyltransferase family 2 protein [Lentzea xinjiangensis]SER78107.1 Glycosyl transferase family 2 [Lentzea xinjiangensis]
MGMMGVVSGLVSALRSARTMTQWQHVARLSASSEAASVLVVVPARDEEAALPSLLPGLVGRPGVRVVVVNDASGDATASVARSLGAEVVESSGPAEGWAGKTHAMHLGVQGARDEEWLLFVDADVTFAPELVGRLVATAAELGADLVSSSGRGSGPAWWFLLPAFNTLVFEGSPPDGRGATALAVGHCVLVRRSAFHAAGGWKALAGTCADDVGLATLLRDAGGVVRFVDASALLTTSGIDTFGDCWRSLRKSIQPTFREMFGVWARPLLVVAGLLHLAYGLVPVLRWRSPWSWLAWFAQAVPHREFVRRVGQPQVSAVLAPLSWATIGVFLLDCALRPGASWKGRRVG